MATSKSAPKTLPNQVSVDHHIAARATPAQLADCQALVALLQRLTGAPPAMWGPSLFATSIPALLPQLGPLLCSVWAAALFVTPIAAALLRRIAPIDRSPPDEVASRWTGLLLACVAATAASSRATTAAQSATSAGSAACASWRCTMTCVTLGRPARSSATVARRSRSLPP